MYRGLGACPPEMFLDFRCSEVRSEAFSVQMSYALSYHLQKLMQEQCFDPLTSKRLQI